MSTRTIIMHLSSLGTDTRYTALPYSIVEKVKKIKNKKIGPQRVRIMLWSVHANQNCQYAPPRDLRIEATCTASDDVISESVTKIKNKIVLH